MIIVVGLRFSGPLASLGAESPGADGAALSLWDVARSQQTVHRFSTLVTAQNVRDHLATEEGLTAAIAWCRETAVTKVYLETFRSKYTAERETLQRVRDRIRSEGFAVSGCRKTGFWARPAGQPRGENHHQVPPVVRIDSREHAARDDPFSVADRA